MKSHILNPKLFVLIVISIVLSQTAIFTSIYGYTYIGWICHILILLAFIPMVKFTFTCNDKSFVLYMIVMSLGFVFHIAIGKLDLLDNFWEVSYWMLIIFLMFIAKKYNPKVLLYLVLIFYVIECGIAVYERVLTSHLYIYDSEILEGFIMGGDLNSSNFRSFSLLGHPLNNANIVSLLMGFLLVNHNIKNKYKFIFIGLGVFALWSFNSRGAIFVWMLILIFRMMLYNIKFISIVVSFVILITIGPYVIDWISSGNLGRFSFDFSDDSSQTRLTSFLYFAAYDWNFENILFGGNLIYMPNTDLLLENGILLCISYWGWVVGPIKILLEIIITYKLIDIYNKREKFIILLSFWGVALMNNNVFNSLAITYFLFGYAALYVYDLKIEASHIANYFLNCKNK